MQLEKLIIENFKRIKTVSLDLADVNILVGPNSSGKSSIIQGVHLACCLIRQANKVDSSTTSTVVIDELDYLPTNEYPFLGHKRPWGNMTGTPSSKMTLTFQGKAGPIVGSCELRAARNAGISIKGNIPGELTSILRRKQKFFSAYIPGISGIPNKEEKKSEKVILKSCSYGDSNIILRNVLLLLKEHDDNNITFIEEWIEKLIGPLKISVNHDSKKDLIIKCEIKVGNEHRSMPIELIGTGYLQLIQIFAYILLFEPGVLLIDEPDIHLHPTVQEKLVGVLAQVAKEKKLKIIMTTHSPFVVRGSPPNIKAYWVNDGVIESENRREVEFGLGWGAFGKKIIMISEDTDLSFLKKIISQWPELERYITFYPGAGFKNVPTPKQASEINEALGGKYKILVHRDRDSLTDQEVEELTSKYSDKGVHIWFTDHSDIEAYFCQKEFLKEFLNCPEDTAEQYIMDILSRFSVDFRNQFDSQREAHNGEFHKGGGSPRTEDVWSEFQKRPLKGAKGKTVFSKLKNKLTQQVFNEKKILDYKPKHEIASSLREKLEQLLGG